MPTTPWQEGDPASKLLFLAEAPSRVEMRMGRPLVGPSGEVFNECLRVAGVSRRQSYILNVWPFMVEKDKAGSILHPNGALLYHHKHGFTEDGLEAAAGTLELLRKAQANLIVSMGQAATHLATGRRLPVTKWRGSLLTGSEAVQGRKVLPTIHPAATLHGTYLWRYLLIHDYELAKEEMQWPELVPPRYDIIIAESSREAVAFLQKCQESRCLCTDIEVINHEVSCFSLAYDKHTAMVVPLHHLGGDPYWSIDDEMAIWTAYAAAMADPETDKINQNIVGFDSPFLLQKMNIFTRGFLGDTMIAQHIIYPDFNKGLDFITSIHTKMPYYKDEGKMWRNEGGDILQFWNYCGRDAIAAITAWGSLSTEMTEGGYWPTYNMTVEMAEALAFMTLHGMKINMEALEDTRNRVAAELERLEAELAAVAEYPFNPHSPKQCAQYFYEHKGITPYRNAQGGITTDDKAMARIVRRYNLPEARLVQEIRARRKLKTTYLEVAFDEDHRLRCSWNPRGTTTGRLSSSQTVFGTGMNMQNLHPAFKGFLVADDDPR